MGLAGSGATSGVAMAHYELHAWCLLVLGWVMVPFYMRSRVYTMPEFLERRFSPTARWVLSIISLVAYILTKIAVGIFAGGVVFGTLIPEWRMNLLGWELDSFWIGSVAVVLLTGLYTVLGGMRAVAYTEAVQTVILVIGSATLTYFGLETTRRLGRVPGRAPVRHVQPLEAARAGGHGGHLGAGEGSRPDRLVLQRQLPLARDALLRAHRGPLVLVHRPVHRPAHAGRPNETRGAPRHASSRPS